MSLEGKHALVTGGATGIGLAIACKLRDMGALVTIASRSKDALNKAVDHESGMECIVLDVTDPKSVADVFTTLKPVDILVNNAGAALTSPFHRTTAADWASMLDVNLTGVFLCTQQALMGMRERGHGRIITISSTAGLKGYAYTAAYAAAKHGVIGMTRSLALELSATGITANCVCPGFADTDIVEKATQNITAKTGRSKEEALQELVKHNPQKLLIDPIEVADCVAYLCADSSGSINGQSIAIAGGEVM